MMTYQFVNHFAFIAMNMQITQKLVLELKKKKNRQTLVS